MVGKSDLFGFKIEDFKDLRAEPETSDRDLSSSGDAAWSGTQIWHEKWKAFEFHFEIVCGHFYGWKSRSRQINTSTLEISV